MHTMVLDLNYVYLQRAWACVRDVMRPTPVLSAIPGMFGVDRQGNVCQTMVRTVDFKYNTVIALFDTLGLNHNGRHFADDILECIFPDEIFHFHIKIIWIFSQESNSVHWFGKLFGAEQATHH